MHDDANRLLEDDAFCYVYDSNGNLATKTAKVAGTCTGDVTTYTWDVQNRLVRVDFPDMATARYRYDALGRRIEKDVNGTITRYIYDEEDAVLEYNSADALVARYAYADKIDQPLALERDGETYFYHIDQIGSIRKVTDASGSVANSYDYESFGRLEARTEGVANPLTYTAREFDAESGLHYYRARYYDPVAGRFLSEDPIGFNSKDLNPYRYVFNRPMTFSDPLGTQVLTTTARLNCFSAAFAGAIVGQIYFVFAQVPPYDETFIDYALTVAEFGARGLVTGCGFTAAFKGLAALETAAPIAGGFLGGVFGIVSRILAKPSPAI